MRAFLDSPGGMVLIEFAPPVTDVAPVALYRGNEAVGMIAELVGKGAQTSGAWIITVPRAVLPRAFHGILRDNARDAWCRSGSPTSEAAASKAHF